MADDIVGETDLSIGMWVEPVMVERALVMVGDRAMTVDAELQGELQKDTNSNGAVGIAQVSSGDLVL